MKRPIYGEPVVGYIPHSDLCGCSVCAARCDRGDDSQYFESKTYTKNDSGYEAAFYEAEREYEFDIANEYVDYGED